MLEYCRLHSIPVALALSAIMAAPLGPAAAAASAPPELATIAGLHVAVWWPSDRTGTHPLVLFSHGFRGCSTQSSSLMRALADSGMLVMAPDHKDNRCTTRVLLSLPLPFELAYPEKWPESKFSDRRQDLENLLAAAQSDARYSPSIDPSRVALVGHSLGGYTVLGLAGAWPTWTISGIAAVVALAPYAETFVAAGSLAEVKTPMLFQAGDADRLVPADRVQQIFATAAAAPRCIVTYQGGRHLLWVDREELPPDAALLAQPQLGEAASAVAVAFLEDVFAGRPVGASLAALRTPTPVCK